MKQLKGFEKVKNIHLEPEPWTPENGILTPTMKLKRPVAKKHYETILERLYKEPRMDEVIHNRLSYVSLPRPSFKLELFCFFYVIHFVVI